MTHNKFNAGFELKFLAETGVFEGYASVFNVVDSVNDKIAPGAFRDSLAACRTTGRLPPLLWQHDAQEPIGAWREMHEDSHGLFVKGDLFINDISLAKEAYKLLKENVVTGLSIGYRTQESYREQKSGARVLTKLDLLEVSLVTFPANEAARVTGVKNRPSPTMDLFNASLSRATAEIKNGIAARRLNIILRQAAADAHQHKEK
jgi:HK97 family phage prohead protease